MPRPPSALQSATSGAVGAMVALALTYPLSVVKTRLQAQRRHSAKENGGSSGVTEYKGMVHCIRSICREEGWVKLYAGFGPALFKSFVTNFVFYFFYGLFSPYFAAKALLQEKHGKVRERKRSLGLPMLHGMLAGACVQLCVLPVDMVVTRTQADRESKVSQPFFKTLSGIVRRNGIFALWSGLGPGLSLTLNPGITTVIRKNLEDMDSLSAHATGNFLIGLVSKATASVTTFPYTVCKVRMQVHGAHMLNKKTRGAGREGQTGRSDSNSTSVERISFFEVIKTVYLERGIFGFYQGLAPQLLNAVLKEGILNMILLEILKTVQNIL